MSFAGAIINLDGVTNDRVIPSLLFHGTNDFS
jgi:hypothetical protein